MTKRSGCGFVFFFLFFQLGLTKREKGERSLQKVLTEHLLLSVEAYHEISQIHALKFPNPQLQKLQNPGRMLLGMGALQRNSCEEEERNCGTSTVPPA